MGDCHTVNFNIATTSTTRAWTIQITQYTCAEDQNTQGGPPGCLQWFTGKAGRVSSFGYDRTIAKVTASVTHLSSQNYQVCIRRESSYCYICYTPVNRGATPTDLVTDQGSFGLSIYAETASPAAKSSVDQYCNADRLTIAGKETTTNAAKNELSATAGTGAFVCGRYLNTDGQLVLSASVCTRNYPFVLGVIMDENENYAAQGTFTAANADKVEGALPPGGIIGFDLYYIQGAC